MSYTVIKFKGWDGWRLAAKSHGWQLEEFQEKDAVSAWVPRVSYPSFYPAALSAFNRAARDGSSTIDPMRVLVKTWLALTIFVLWSVGQGSADEGINNTSPKNESLPVVYLSDGAGWRISQRCFGFLVEESVSRGESKAWKAKTRLPGVESAALYALDRALRENGAEISSIFAAQKVFSDVFKAVFAVFNSQWFAVNPKPPECA